MKKFAKSIVALAAAATLVLPLAACGGTSTGSNNAAKDSGTASTQQSSDFDAVAFYAGETDSTWRASVETTGATAYGNVAGSEPMLDLIINADGTCSTEPLENHKDLLTAEGTWEGTESELTLTLDGATVALTVVDDTTLTGNPADFGIEGFDELTFTLY